MSLLRRMLRQSCDQEPSRTPLDRWERIEHQADRILGKLDELLRPEVDPRPTGNFIRDRLVPHPHDDDKEAGS